MATVRPGILCASEADANRTGKVTDVELDAAVASRVRVVEHIPADSQASIAEAKRLLVSGRGIGSKKNLPVMRRLAELLGAEIGCTRPLVEAGWLEYRHQVGQTGVSVAPELLVGLGVSGAIQHLAGISGAQTVVAVNEDADAPIFNAAQYAVVGDCVEVAQRTYRPARNPIDDPRRGARRRWPRPPPSLLSLPAPRRPRPRRRRCGLPPHANEGRKSLLDRETP